jgi:aerobic carbon-monoxide dehydrogenase large subunit
MSFKGNWAIQVNAPLGVQKFTLAADVQEDLLIGVVTNGEGTQEILNGKVNGDEASWDLPINKPMKLTVAFSALLDGDEISGSARIGALGTAKFTGVRTV